VKMVEARNYLYKLAEGKEAQRKKDLAYWDGIIEALGLVPRTRIVESLILFCKNRRAVFTDQIQTGCAPDVTFYGAMLEEMAKYKGKTEEELLRMVIEANAPKIVVPTPAAAVPVAPPIAPVPSKPVVAGETDDTSDMDDDEELDGKPAEAGNPEI
jgi:hypothetical protein